MTPGDSAAPSPPGAAPLHVPKRCRRCGAPVFWGQLLDRAGNRQRRGDGVGWKAIAVDAEPHPEGRVLLAHREGEGIVACVLPRCSLVPRGKAARRRHLDTCPGREDFRQQHEAPTT